MPERSSYSVVRASRLARIIHQPVGRAFEPDAFAIRFAARLRFDRLTALSNVEGESLAYGNYSV